MMSTEILEQSPLYRRWIAEGKAEGEIQGVREATLAALRGRWPNLAADVEAAVSTASIETLLEVLSHVTADSQEQMRAPWPLIGPRCAIMGW